MKRLAQARQRAHTLARRWSIGNIIHKSFLYNISLCVGSSGPGKNDGPDCVEAQDSLDSSHEEKSGEPLENSADDPTME